jgi:nucleotide-binding universal stress UspA family protein
MEAAMPKTLIVPLDGSRLAERGLTCAQELASHLETCDIVVMTASTAGDRRRRAYIETAAERAEDPRVSAEYVVGDPAASLVSLVLERSDAVVCMTTHGCGGPTVRSIGSVTSSVLRTLAAPMFLTGPSCRSHWWRSPPLLVAYWDDETPDMLTPATEWSGALGMDLRLESVHQPFDTCSSVPPSQFLDRAQASVTRDREEVATLVLHDDFAPRAVVRSAVELPATLLATPRRPSAAGDGTPLDGDGLEIVLHSPCPILLVGGTTT